MELLQIFLLSFVRINSTYSVRFRAKADVSDLLRDTIKFAALKSVWRFSGGRGMHCSCLNFVIHPPACFFPALFCWGSSERWITTLTDAHQAEVNAAAGDVMIPARFPSTPAAVCLIQQRPRSRRVRGWEMTSGRGWKRPEGLILPSNLLFR